MFEVEKSASTASSLHVDAGVHAELVSLLYGNTKLAVLLILAIAAVVAIPVAQTTSPIVVWTWLSTAYALGIVRLLLLGAYRRSAFQVERARNWEWGMIAVVTLNGVCWGALGPVLFIHGGVVELGIAAFVLGGIKAAAVATLGSSRAAYLGFSLPIMALMIVGLLWRGDSVATYLIWMILCFEVVMIGTVHRVHHLFRRNIELRLANEGLVQSLTASAASLNLANGSLEREISERRRAQEQIEFLANHDALTGLPNRLLQHDRFEQAVARAKRTGARLALLFVDLDHFKAVNDTFGHPVGDALLCEVANRLQACLRGGDSACRQGGDEFLLLLTEVEDRAVTAAIAKRVLALLCEPILLGGQRLEVGGSIGISMYPDDGTDFEVLISRSDRALYAAKHAGRAQFRFFDTLTETQPDGEHVLTAVELPTHHQDPFDRIRSGAASTNAVDDT